MHRGFYFFPRQMIFPATPNLRLSFFSSTAVSFFPAPAVYFSCNPQSEAFIFSLHRGFVFSRLRLSFFTATNQQPGLLFFSPWTTDSWSFRFFPPGVRRRNSCTTTRRVPFSLPSGFVFSRTKHKINDGSISENGTDPRV